MRLCSRLITYLHGFFNFLNSIIKIVKYQKLVQINFLESFLEVFKNMKYLQKSLQLNSVAVNKLIFFEYFLQLILLFTRVSFCQYFIYDFFFIYCVWLRLSFLFHIFEPLWNLKFMKVKSQKYIMAYVI